MESGKHYIIHSVMDRLAMVAVEHRETTGRSFAVP